MAKSKAEAQAQNTRKGFLSPLKATLMIVFFLTTVPVLIAILQINQNSSAEVVRGHVQEMVERFRQEKVREILDEFDKIQSIVATAAELGRQAPDFFGDERALRYLFSLLQHSETILSAYIGREDGSFWQARLIHDHSVEIHGQRPPRDAEFMYRVVQPQSGTVTVDRFSFLDPDQNAIGEVAAESSYDPRQRPWYRLAANSDMTEITDPELFWAFGLIGFTVAEHYEVAGDAGGVVAADITLDSFSSYLARQPVSANSVSYLLDDRGLVLASSDGTTLYGNDNTGFSLPHVAEVENRLAAIAYGHRSDGSAGNAYEFTDNGSDYIVGFSSFAEELGKPWRLMIITPVSDFTDEFTRSNQRMLMMGLGAIAVQMLIIYMIASLVADPLQRLAGKVARIQSLKGSGDLLVRRTHVREIDMLAQAVDALDTAIQAFARFVPVELVRALLTSDGKLELGGQSRFLTIFFCDVEAFSTLAERIATRDLLSRVSVLLSNVHKRVDEENGTIDKFIGDGVMAFWGAPVALDDHAWHACVAALAIQRDLDRLNSEWSRNDAPGMRLRIGIHSDVVLVGNIGSKERMSYTVLGDGVNIASRLEGCNKIYGSRICISHDTFREAGDRICVRPIDDVQVKGRRASFTIYELLGAYGADPSLEPDGDTVKIARTTQAAFDALVSGDLKGALALYRKVLEALPDDPVATLHVSRLEKTE